MYHPAPGIARTLDRSTLRSSTLGWMETVSQKSMCKRRKYTGMDMTIILTVYDGESVLRQPALPHFSRLVGLCSGL